MVENLLKEEIVQQLRDVFDNQLKQPVELIYFGKKTDCETCDDSRRLLEEVTSISEKLHLSSYDLDDHNGISQKYKINMVPGFVIAGRDGDTLVDYGIRFAGIPAGYEFSSLIQDIILVSGRDSGLKPEIRQALKDLKKPVHLQVFVTPT